jgi:hypothetical protein
MADEQATTVCKVKGKGPERLVAMHFAKAFDRHAHMSATGLP